MFPPIFLSQSFFDQLISNIYGAVYTSSTTALAVFEAENKAETVKKKTTSSGYTSLCIVLDNADNPDCSDDSDYSYPFPDSVFQNKRFVLHEGQKPA